MAHASRLFSRHLYVVACEQRPGFKNLASTYSYSNASCQQQSVSIRPVLLLPLGQMAELVDGEKESQGGRELSSSEQTKTAFIDDKFDVVISELEQRGWKRCPFQSSRCDLVWTNLARIDWKKITPSQIVNHVRGSQHLSNKSFLAFHMAACGNEHHMPLQWSAAYQDLGELISMVALCTIYGAYVAILENEHGGQEEGKKAMCSSISEVEKLLRIIDMDADVKKSASNESSRFLLAALTEGSDLGAALTSIEKNKGGMISRSLVGSKGIWIVKEVGSSCGRGISICAGAKELLRVVESMNFKCVVQKYIERPLLVRNRRKFDIRQWIVVRSLNPLVIYGFSEFYCRLSRRVYDLSPEHYEDPAMHLCNHAVQSAASESTIDGATSSTSRREKYQCDSMMSQAEFEEHLQSLSPPVSLPATLLPQIKQASVDAVSSVTSSLSTAGKSSFEWLGLDLMVTEDMTVRLIEVNVSPDVSQSTPITARLVKSAVRGLLPLVLEEATPEEEGTDPAWEQWYPKMDLSSMGEVEVTESKHEAKPRSLSSDYSPRKKHIFDRALLSLEPMVSSDTAAGGSRDEGGVLSDDSEEEL